MTTKAPVESQEAGPTDIEVSIAKFEKTLANKKHIDARDFGLNFVFPLLRRLAKALGDQEEQLADAVEDLADLAEGGGEAEQLVDAFEKARDMLAKIGGLLDATMVAAGFYSVTNAGLVATDKVPSELRVVYEALGTEARQVVVDIQEAIEAVENRDDDDDDDGDGGDDGEGADEGEDEDGVGESVTTPVEVDATVSTTEAVQKDVQKDEATNAA